LRFRGREMAHPEIGRQMLDQVVVTVSNHNYPACRVCHPLQDEGVAPLETGFASIIVFVPVKCVSLTRMARR
jgi:hypothetical protein